MPSHHRYSPYFPLLFLFADLAAFNLSFAYSIYLKYSEFILDQAHLSLLLLLNIIWIFVFYSSRLQEIDRNSRLLDHLNKVLTGLVINLSIVFALWFALQPIEYSRKFLFYTYLSFTLLTLLWRSIWHYLIRYYRARGYNYRNVLIIGKDELSDSLVKHIQLNSYLGYKLKRVINVEKINQLDDICKKLEVDVIFCCLPNLNENQIQDIIEFAENNLIKVNLFSQFSRLMNYDLSIGKLGSIPIINVNTIPLDLTINRFTKRVFDIIFSLFVFVLILSWLVPLIGIIIKLESKGPIFFRQKRHGRDNQQFMIYKFRSMRMHQDERVKQATRGDTRITKIGEVLRKTSIDELPQFINVLRGEMSVVGPRPHAVQHNMEYQPKIDKFWQRHAVKPGITGLAQARGFRGETAELFDMSGRVRLDRFYVKNWSLTLDFKIILLTALAIIKGDQKAY